VVPDHQQLHSATEGTPASNNVRAYASPSSRSTSFSPLMISAYTSTRGLHRLFEQTETQSMRVPYVENAYELFWNSRASPRWATEFMKEQLPILQITQ
jgi:hypothetical protein